MIFLTILTYLGIGISIVFVICMVMILLNQYAENKYLNKKR